MLKTCTICKKEFESKRADARYCGATCRQNAKRVTDKDVTVKSVTDNNMVLVTDTLKEKKFELLDVCTPHELEVAPNMCETKKEQKESIYRLENNKLSQLEKKKIWIPNWRRLYGENPGKAPM